MIAELRLPVLGFDRGVVHMVELEAGKFDWDAYGREKVELPPGYTAMATQRATEYLAGRVCARAALRKLGAGGSVASGNGIGPPRWPAGTVGSIAHSRRLVLAAACWRHEIRSVGIDTEAVMSAEVAEEVGPAIASKRERSYLQNLEGARELLLTVLFAAKEAAFKCLFGCGFRPQDPHDLALVAANLERGEAEVRFEAQVLPVTIARAYGHVHALAFLPRFGDGCLA
jgi:4'-phosphopantetheinyl transferase EntD